MVHFGENEWPILDEYRWPIMMRIYSINACIFSVWRIKKKQKRHLINQNLKRNRSPKRIILLQNLKMIKVVMQQNPKRPKIKW